MRDPRRFALAAAASVLLWCSGCSVLDGVQVPENTPFEKVRWAEQGWPAELRSRVHHLPQGTASLPMSAEWFRALEQPSWWLDEQPRIADPAYLRRFGFLMEDDDPTGLPVGFALDEDYQDPATGEQFAALGFTCAACHTGQLEYRGVSFRIEGAPARIALDRFANVLALSILQTTYLPGRFERVADRILGRDRSDEAEQQLERQLDRMRGVVLDQIRLRWSTRQHSVREGFGRRDVMTRIGNQIFAVHLDQPANFRGYAAPVSFPPLWDTPWFDSALYNGSLRDPVLRNAAESLGIGAGLNLTAPERGLFRSTLELDQASELTRWLAGWQPPRQAGRFTGLLAPEWPEDLLGPIDRGRAAEGEHLYDQLCMQCHGPPPNREDFFDAPLWTEPDASGVRYLQLAMIPLEEIGTDPAHARSMQQRKVRIPEALGLAGDDDRFAPRLAQVLQKSVAQAKPSKPVQNAEIDAPLAYRARPLDGIWATAPYLHNDSVPNLYALLSPVAERPMEFALDTRKFDPVAVGYETESQRHGFALDTRLDGNRNTGHEFNDGEGPGILGRKLTKEERYQLVEFLKTITSRRLSVGRWRPSPMQSPTPEPAARPDGTLGR